MKSSERFPTDKKTRLHRSQLINNFKKMLISLPAAKSLLANDFEYTPFFWKNLSHVYPNI